MNANRQESDSLPFVSVVVPAFNAKDHIGDAIESIRQQTGGFRTEILVIDDGSTDSTCALVVQYDGIRLFSQVNAGPSAARNRGIAEAGGEFVAFLDADDIWPPGKLAAQLAIFEEYPEVGLVFGDCRIFTESGQQPYTLFESEKLGPEFWGSAGVVVDPYRKLFRTNFIPTGSVVVRKACFEKTGLFDEDRRLVEDKELWLRFALHCQFGYTTHLCELKREHDNNVSHDREGMALAHISVLQEQLRDYPDEVRRCGVNVHAMISYEYSILGDRRERDGDIKAARAWYRKALFAYPSIRPVYYWLRTWL